MCNIIQGYQIRARLRELDEIGFQTRKIGNAVRTNDAYRPYMANYMHFCQEFNLSAMNVCERQVQRYISWMLKETNLRNTSASKAVSALTNYWKVQGKSF